VSRTTIALVDDHPLVSYSIVTALGAAGITCVPVEPGPAAEVQAAIADIAPDLVLLDLDLGPFGDSLPLIEPLTAAGIRVVMLTAETDRLRLAQTLERGALRIVPKTSAFPELIASIRSVAADPPTGLDAHGERLLAELADQRRRAADARAPFDTLTTREQEVLAALADGDTVRDIAHNWVVSETTVRSHVRAILLKLDVQSQLQAVVKAVQQGWVPRPPDPAPAHAAADAHAGRPRALS
jgi:DNA-binding NarL/FixJ family response regulator